MFAPAFGKFTTSLSERLLGAPFLGSAAQLRPSRRTRFAYIAFWGCTMALKILFDYMMIIQPLVELICWLGLGVLEIVPRLTAISTMSSQDHSAIFKSSWWAYIVTGYELFVFNPLYPLRTIYQCTPRNSRLGLAGNSH